MEVIIVDDADVAATICTGIISDLIQSTPTAVLGLATGNTPLKLYQQLITRYQNRQLSFKKISTFNLDEYIGVEVSSQISYRNYMNNNLFNHIDIHIENTHVPNGMTNDPLQESKRYEQVIRNLGGIDLQILGIGRNGHIGFNEPTSSLASRTRIKTLTPSTMHDNSRLLEDGEAQPKSAITMGIATILEARQLVLMATGPNKADAIKATIEGPLSAMCPASTLQMHPNVKVIVDEGAANKLELKGYYRSVYQENMSMKNI